MMPNPKKIKQAKNIFWFKNLDFIIKFAIITLNNTKRHTKKESI